MLKRLVIVSMLSVLAVPVVAQTKKGAEQGYGLKTAEEAYQRKDYVTATRIWEKLARQGSAPAQFNMGVMYAAGRGVPKNYKKAAYWHEKAARQGLARAQTMLGIMYNDGTGVPKNYVLSYMWYSIAAGNGHEPSASFRDALANKMTAHQITRAKGYVTMCGYKPATCP